MGTHEEDYYWVTDDLMPGPEEEYGNFLVVEESVGLPEDYLTQTVEEPSKVKPERFGRESTAEGPDETNL